MENLVSWARENGISRMEFVQAMERSWKVGGVARENTNWGRWRKKQNDNDFQEVMEEKDGDGKPQETVNLTTKKMIRRKQLKKTSRNS